MHQTRLERDASRATPDNWARIDHTARVDADRWDRDPPPHEGDLDRETGDDSTASPKVRASQSEPSAVVRLDSEGKIVGIDLEDDHRWWADSLAYEYGQVLYDSMDSILRIRADHGDKEADAPDPTGEELLEVDEDDRSRAERIRRRLTRAENVENVQDTLSELGEKAQGLLDRRPPVAHTVISDRTYATEPTTPREALDGGLTATIPFVVWVIAHHAARRLGTRPDRSDQPKGDHRHAGD
ncbi:MAG TPA: hypothetical protein VI076_01875 [Actinopolymorphaceae bacterium]